MATDEQARADQFWRDIAARARRQRELDRVLIAPKASRDAVVANWQPLIDALRER